MSPAVQNELEAELDAFRSGIQASGLRTMVEVWLPPGGNERVIVVPTAAVRNRVGALTAVQAVGYRLLTIDEAAPDRYVVTAVVTLETGRAGELADELVPGQSFRTIGPLDPGTPALVVVDHAFGGTAPRQVGWLTCGLGAIELSVPRPHVTRPGLTPEAFARELGPVSYRRCGKVPRTGLDCSGLVQLFVHSRDGVWLPRLSRWQALALVSVPPHASKPGDLVFFARRSEIDHVGILGDGVVIHCTAGHGLLIEPLARICHGGTPSFGRVPL